jgi:hypothetical protein
MTNQEKPMRSSIARDPLAVDAVATPWWRVAMVWLVLSGPVAVIVAGIVTMTLAWRHVDPLVTDAPQARAAVPNTSTSPAMQARNHAATPAR